MDPDVSTAMTRLAAYGSDISSVSIVEYEHYARSAVLSLLAAAGLVAALHQARLSHTDRSATAAESRSRMDIARIGMMAALCLGSIVVGRGLPDASTDRVLIEARIEHSCAVMRLASVEGRTSGVPSDWTGTFRTRCGDTLPEAGPRTTASR